jgi:hypothetical protein
VEVVEFVDIRIFASSRYYKSSIGLPMRLLVIESDEKAAS